ncbi:hypothetical protein GCM10009433_02760 [Psychroflexus lacisalsi]|uniref:Uncharacterized protein n=1 Tax=Psychroflexus lacisalsi TaxID=503928 RepID=A0ABN1K1C6_9FLAO
MCTGLSQSKKRVGLILNYVALNSMKETSENFPKKIKVSSLGLADLLKLILVQEVCNFE